MGNGKLVYPMSKCKMMLFPFATYTLYAHNMYIYMSNTNITNDQVVYINHTHKTTISNNGGFIITSSNVPEGIIHNRKFKTLE